jgi:hypothetical protein
MAHCREDHYGPPSCSSTRMYRRPLEHGAPSRRPLWPAGVQLYITAAKNDRSLVHVMVRTSSSAMAKRTVTGGVEALLVFGCPDHDFGSRRAPESSHAASRWQGTTYIMCVIPREHCR